MIFHGFFKQKERLIEKPLFFVLRFRKSVQGRSCLGLFIDLKTTNLTSARIAVVSEYTESLREYPFD